MYTHTKFGLKSPAVRVAFIPVALMFGIYLVYPLSTVLLPGMPWNSPTIDSLGKVCHSLYDSVRLKLSVFLLLLERQVVCFVCLLSQGPTALHKPSLNWESSCLTFLNVGTMSLGDS